MAPSRNTTKITQEKDGTIIFKRFLLILSQSCWGTGNGTLTCGGTHWPLQVQEWEEKCREPAPGQGKCKSRAVPRERALLPAGNSPSLCSPAQRLFSAEIGHWYPQLKEKRRGSTSRKWLSSVYLEWFWMLGRQWRARNMVWLLEQMIPWKDTARGQRN